MSDKTIDLDDLIGYGDSDRSSGLILVMDSGVVWTRQAGGTACGHPSVMGVFVPLPEAEDFAFCHDLRPDWCLTSRDGDTLDRVDAELAPAGLAVDRAALVDPDERYGEAWLPVVVLPSVVDHEAWAAVLGSFIGWTAILTWPNSD